MLICIGSQSDYIVRTILSIARMHTKAGNNFPSRWTVIVSRRLSTYLETTNYFCTFRYFFLFARFSLISSKWRFLFSNCNASDSIIFQTLIPIRQPTTTFLKSLSTDMYLLPNAVHEKLGKYTDNTILLIKVKRANS